MGLDDILSEILRASVFASMIRLATPYIFAGLGEMFSQRSGVLNLGVEGVMLLGAFGAFYTVFTVGSLALAMLVAMMIGAIMGLATAFISVTLKAEQGISGIGIYLFGLGMSQLLMQELIGGRITVSGFPRIDFPVLTDIEVLGIGQILFNHNLLVYVAFALVPVSAFILNKTTFGLQIRAVGQHPEAADAMGVSVAGVRYLTVTLGGIMSGIAGASLSIALLNVFQENLTSGLGFVAVALVYFGGWRPYGVMAGALLFGYVNAAILQLQVALEREGQSALVLAGLHIPPDILVLAPPIIIIIALIFAARRKEKPTALTKPFERGE